MNEELKTDIVQVYFPSAFGIVAMLQGISYILSAEIESALWALMASLWSIYYVLLAGLDKAVEGGSE